MDIPVIVGERLDATERYDDSRGRRHGWRER